MGANLSPILGPELADTDGGQDLKKGGVFTNAQNGMSLHCNPTEFTDNVLRGTSCDLNVGSASQSP